MTADHTHDPDSNAGTTAAAVIAAGRSYRIHGMDCAEEVATLKDALRGLAREDELAFDVLRGRMIVPATVPPDQLVTAVARTGMRAEPWVDQPTSASGPAWSNREVLVAVSSLGTVIGFCVHVLLAGLTAAIGSEGAGLAEVVPWPARLAYGVAIAAGCGLWLPKAWYAAAEPAPRHEPADDHRGRRRGGARRVVRGRDGLRLFSCRSRSRRGASGGPEGRWLR
jgi:Cd2+/Zn2+-exporting ATPase